jgi:hypothetical protein
MRARTSPLRLLGESLEDRNQPALLAISLPLNVLSVELIQTPAVTVEVIRVANPATSSTPTGPAATPSGTAVSPVPPAGSSLSTVPSAVANATPGNTVAATPAGLFPETGTGYPAAAPFAPIATFLPPDAQGQPTAGPAQPVAQVHSFMAGVGPASRAADGAAAAPNTAPVPVGGVNGPALPAAPAPRPVEGTAPSGNFTAPPPREVGPAPAKEQTSSAPPAAANAESPAAAAVAATTSPETKKEETEGTNWGWYGAAAAALAVGGYWLVRRVRLNLQAKLLPFRKRSGLPYGTILSTEVEMI